MSFTDVSIVEDINTDDLLSLFHENNEFVNLALGTVLVKNEEPAYEPNYNANAPVEYLNIPPPTPQIQYEQQQQEEEKPQLEEPLGLNMPSQIISNDFAGDYDFEIYINPHHGKKSPWVYSSPLGKIFITMGQLFPIEFKCRFPGVSKLYVRATPIYSDTQHKNQLVTRCITHAQEVDRTNVGCKVSLLDHVIRCQDRNAVYGGSKRDGKHLYVRVPLNPPMHGNDTSIMNFQFMCKNSCESGMNRRAMEVVFTLENDREETLGRRVLHVRVCSCPKRDKVAAEKAHPQQQGNEAGPNSKKRKLEKKQHSSFSTEQVDEEKVRTWQINLPTNAAVTKLAFKMVHMALTSEMHVNKEVDQKAIKKCIDDIQLLMQSQP